MSDKYEFSTGSAFSTFDKLRGENYWGWRENMITTASMLNQMVVLEGNVPVPKPKDASAPTDAEKKEKADYDLRLARAYAEIALRVDPAWKQPISEKRNDPAGAWKALEEAYGSSLSGTRSVLFGELASIRYDGTTPIQIF